MAEEKVQEDQIIQKGGGTEPPSEKKKSVGKRVFGAFLDMRDLITRSKKKKGKPAGETAPVQKGKKPALSMPAVFSGRKLELKLVNHILITVLAGLVGLTIYFAVRQRPDISSVTVAVSKINFTEVEEAVITTFGQLSHYLDQIGKRDIFNPVKEEVVEKPKPVVKQPVKDPGPPPPPKITIEEKAKNLKVMGISWGDNPKVMITDQSTQSMFFVTEGDVIENTDLTVKKIFQKEVIIESEGEEMSIF